MNIHKLILLVHIAFFSISPLRAGVGSSSAEFLLLPVGARPSAMGDSFVGIADDIQALGYNPAGLGLLEKHELLLMHSVWLVDTTYEYGAYAHKLPLGTLGFSATYVDAGDLIGRNSMGHPTGNFTASDLSLKIGYGYRFLEQMHVGFAGTCIMQKIDDASRSGAAVDLGFLWEIIPEKFNLGSCIQNAGPRLQAFDTEDETLPTVYQIGIGYYLFDNALIIGSELKKIIHGKPSFNSGFEYKIKDIIFLRSGAVFGSDRDESLPFSFGLGLQIRNYQFDYCFEPFSDLDVTHKIAFLIKI
ncbi:MAG: PorV/PorQ family protein [bacterium]